MECNAITAPRPIARTSSDAADGPACATRLVDSPAPSRSRDEAALSDEAKLHSRTVRGVGRWSVSRGLSGGCLRGTGPLFGGSADRCRRESVFARTGAQMALRHVDLVVSGPHGAVIQGCAPAGATGCI